MEESSLYRKESMRRIQSPEELNDYLRITSPAVWVVLAGVILLLAGLLVWGSFARIDSFASGTARVENGEMTIVFDDAAAGGNVEPGMTVRIGDVSVPVKSVGRSESGAVFALADADLADGEYRASVIYRQTQVIRLLFN